MAGIADATGVQWRGGTFTDHAIVDWYEPIINDTLNSVTKWYDMIASNDQHIVGGKFIRWLNRTARGQGYNFMDPRGYLPDPVGQTWSTSFNHVKDYYWRIKVDGKTMRQSRSNRGAYLEAVDSEMRYIIEDIQVDWNRALLNDGSGRLAVVNGVPSGTTITCALHSGVTSKTNAGNAPTQWITPGMRVSFIESNGDTPITTTVTSVTSDTVFEVASGSGIVDGDWITRCSRSPSTSLLDMAYRNEVLGLEGMFGELGVLDGNGDSTGTPVTGSGFGNYDMTSTSEADVGFQGLPVDASNQWNQAIIFDNGATGRDTTDELLQQALSGAERINNSNVNLILMSYGVYNNYLTDLYADKRYVNTDKLTAGGTVATFHGIPIHKEKDMYGGRAYFIDTSQISMQQVEGINWLNQDGSIWNRVTDVDAWEAAGVKSCQMMCYTRERLGASLTDLNEDAASRQGFSATT